MHNIMPASNKCHEEKYYKERDREWRSAAGADSLGQSIRKGFLLGRDLTEVRE